MPASHLLLLSELPWAGPTAHRISGADTMMNLGEPLDEAPGPLTYELRVDPRADPSAFPPLDWHDPSGGQPLLSRRMVDTLLGAGIDNIVFYPATVRYQPTGALLDYCVGNVVGRVSALDKERSEVVLSTRGRLMGIRRLALDEARCRGLHLFRLGEQPQTIVVSAALGRRLTEAGLTGLRLLPDHAWKEGMI